MLTKRQARALWEKRTQEIRILWKQSERTDWATATATVARSLNVLEATAILAHLRERRALCSHDRLLADALAARLGLTVEYRRRGLLEETT